MFASATVVHSVPNDDVISTSERCISRQDFPYRRCYIDIRCDITALRYGRHTFCPARVTGEYSACRGSTSLDFLYGPTAKSCIIKALRALLSLRIILRKRQQRCATPREASQRGETSWNAKSSRNVPIMDPSNLLAKIMHEHVPSKVLVFLHSTFSF